MELDWASLHKILSDTTRRSILELLAEREALSYTEIMTLLQVTNTGRLNYHLKVLGGLLSKDEGGRYHLTEQGRQAANLLRTFPERVPPERKLSALKIMASVVLILLGFLLILSFAFLLLSAAGPMTASTGGHIALSAQSIPQNMTIYLAGWTLSGSKLNIAWNAANPISIFVLNQTQYDTVLFGQSSRGHTPEVPYNFTGTPESWVRDFDTRTDNLSVSLPQGQYYFYAWSATPNLLDSFGLAQSQTQSEGTLLSPFLVLYSSIFVAIGAFFLVLAVSILTRRIWR